MHFFVANVAFTRFFCRKCRDYTLFGVEFWQKFWQKFLEILRILAEILRKKLACGASVLLMVSLFLNIVPVKILIIASMMMILMVAFLKYFKIVC